MLTFFSNHKSVIHNDLYYTIYKFAFFKEQLNYFMILDVLYVFVPYYVVMDETGPGCLE